MIVKIRFYFLLFALGCTALLFSQEVGFVRGTIIDSSNKEPVAFATIRVKGTAVGVISNKDGSFKVPLEFQQKGNELEVSSMGYEIKIVVFDELNNSTVNNIYLKPALFQLAETVVKARKKRRYSAKQIIRYAFQQIPDNYENFPFELLGYYRDYQLRQGEYVNLNEAIIKVYDQGFAINDHTSTDFGLYEYSQNHEFAIDSFAAKPYDYSARDKFIPNANFNSTYAGNELVLLFIHDVIRNHRTRTYSFVYTLIEDFIREHRFSRVRNTIYGDQKVYMIEFRKSDTPFQVKGTIYIDQDDYAIRKLDYSVFKQKADDRTPTLYSLSEKDLLYEILVEYQDWNGRMYLNYISFHNQFKLIRPPTFFVKAVLPNTPKREIKIFLNKAAANWPNHFTVKYRGNNLKITGIDKIDQSTVVVRLPKNNAGQQKNTDLLFSELEDNKKTFFDFSIKELVDSEGNHLGQRKSELLDQFREFFTQRIFTDTKEARKDMLVLDKTQSLGLPTQPKLEVGKDTESWMNTPLKSKQ